MNPVAAQGVALDNALVAPEKRLKIEKCNARIEFNKPQREETYQVTLDALKLSPYYPVFLITAEVPEICSRLPNQDFVEPPFEEEMVPFIQELSYSGKCDMLFAIHTDQMHHPWRKFVAIINRFISRKSIGLDRLRPLRAQILWGMFNQKNVDYVALLWEDFMFQTDNREISFARKENMPYPRFTKVIIGHFISKDKTISMRNMINLHTVHDDTLLGTLKFVSKTQDYQQYGALIPEEMINQDIKDSKAYNTYLDFATGKATPKKARKFKKVASPSKKLSPVLEELAAKPKQAKKPAKKSTTVPRASVIIRDTPGVSVSKKKAPTKADRRKGMDLLTEAALLEAAQLKKTLKKRKQETHKLHASGSGDGVGSQPKVPDEQQDKTTGINKGSGTIPRVPDVPKYQSESKNESWGNSKDDDSDDVTNDDDNDVDSDADGDNEASDSEKTDSDEDDNPNLNQNKDEEEEYEEEYVRTPDNYEFSDDDEEYEELYKDVNVRLRDAEHEEEGKGDAEMIDVGRGDGSQEKSYEKDEEDVHVTLTVAHVIRKTKGPMQSSSVSFDFASQFLNLDNVPPVDNEVVSTMNVKVSHEEPSTQTPSFLTIPVTVIPETSMAAAPTIPLTIPPITPLSQQSTPTLTPAPTTETTTTLIPTLPDFSSLFGFKQRVSVLEKELS
ncbi:hypothetical protein Tco_0586862 [Tanacetum coccineum]